MTVGIIMTCSPLAPRAESHIEIGGAPVDGFTCANTDISASVYIRTQNALTAEIVLRPGVYRAQRERSRDGQTASD